MERAPRTARIEEEDRYMADPDPSGLHPFDADTAVRAVGGGRYEATVSDRWGLLGAGGGFANGGYALALCLRAMGVQARHPDPLAVSATYLSRVRFGPALIEVELIRHGRRLSSLQARLLQRDGGGDADTSGDRNADTGGVVKERLRVVASFADLGAATGRTELRNAPPDLPPVAECLALATRDGVPGFSLADRLEFRYVQLPGWRRGTPEHRLEDQFWMRFAPENGRERHADTIALAAMVDMATPPVIDLGERGSTTIELSVHVRGVPAPGWLACRASTRHVIDGYHDEDFEIWDSTGALVAQSRQLAVLSERRD